MSVEKQPDSNPAFELDAELELDISNPFNMDALDLLLTFDTSPITNPNIRSPQGVFCSKMRSRFRKGEIKHMASLHGTKLVFIAVAARQHLSSIQSFADTAIRELARPQGTKIRFRISNLSGYLHAKKLVSVLEAFGKVIFLRMGSPNKNDNKAEVDDSKLVKADFGTSAVCIMEVRHGMKLPGKLSWTLGGNKITMPISLLALEPRVPVQNGREDSAQPGKPAEAVPVLTATNILDPISVKPNPLSPQKFSDLVCDDLVTETREALLLQPQLASGRVPVYGGFAHPLALCGSVAMASLLLEAKADVNALNSERESALFSITQPAVVPFLAQHQANLDLRDSKGRTALQSWRERLGDCNEDASLRNEAQAMIDALEHAEQNSGWNVQMSKKRSRSPSHPSPIAHGRAVAES